MIPLRKPKRRPSNLECSACHQTIGWQHCEYCHGYGSWDQGVGAFRCLFCGGTGWQSEPHACIESDEVDATGDEPGREADRPPSDARDSADSWPAEMGPALNIQRIALLSIVVIALLLILAGALAGLTVNIR